MRSATTWLGIAGGFLMVVLMGRNFKGAISIGILFVTFISWIPNHGVREGGEVSTQCEECCREVA
jgi:AGZA family xanthine/uracil permease-like MFS transporter